MITNYFSDLDDVLAHKERPKAEEASIEVGNGFYIARTNLERLRELRSSGKLKFGIVTTRRFSTAQTALSAIPHDYAVIDHGTIILTGEEPDREWLETLRPYIGNPLVREKTGLLWEYEAKIRTMLGREGFEIHSDDRFGSFRVIPPSPSARPDLERVLQIKRPDGIDAIIVRGFVDFFPSLAGKANGVKRILAINGVTDYTSVAYAGDDISDMAALAQFSALTTSEAEQSVRELVLARGGYVSPKTKHEATQDLISHVEAISRQDTHL